MGKTCLSQFFYLLDGGTDGVGILDDLFHPKALEQRLAATADDKGFFAFVQSNLVNSERQEK